jgi:hypothetical protein
VELPECYDPNGIRSVAVHEAGHAVATVVLGLELKSVEVRPHILPDGRLRFGLTDAPITDADFAGRGENAAMPYLIQGWSGPVAEQKVNPRYHEYNGGTNDFKCVKQIAVIAICNFASAENVVITEEQRVRVNALLDSAWVAADSLVEAYWPAIKRVATLLGKRQELSGDEVAKIVKTARPRGGSLPNHLRPHFHSPVIR